MSALKALIGKSSGSFRDEVSLNRISTFCRAIGVKESSIAPPTFLTVFRKGEFTLFQALGIDLSHILHAEQDYQYENQIMAGDCVCFETVISNILEKHRASSPMQFITLETIVHVERFSETQRVGKAKTTIVVR
jgi:hypothetical protein